MKLSNSFIAIKKIQSSVPASNFSENDLSRAAELILKVEGIINPLILRRNSPQSYEVVDGHFEYHAAVKAKEIDNQKGEYIGAFIIEADNEEVLQKQIELIRQRELGDNKIEQKLGSLIVQITELAEAVKKIEEILSDIHKQKPSNHVKIVDDGSEYSSMSVAQLKNIAKQHQIKGYSKMNKKELITAIKNSLKI